MRSCHVATASYAFVFAVILQVSAGIGIGTFSSGITDLAGVTVAIGVRISFNYVAVTWVNAISGNAAVAGFSTNGVAAVSVYAEASVALDALVTRFAWVLGRHTGTVVITVVTGHTVIVRFAAIEAIEPSVVADVGFTALGARVITNASAIAGIGEVQSIHVAQLSNTDGSSNPLVAGASTIAIAVGATS